MGIRVLWIEDEIFKLKGLINGLREKNVEVITAATEEEWNRWLKKDWGYFNLVLMDVMLPKGGKVVDVKPQDWRRRGEKLVHDIRGRWKDTPIVVFTALPADINEDRMKSIGANAYLEKPVLVREFEEAISKWLNFR